MCTVQRSARCVWTVSRPLPLSPSLPLSLPPSAEYLQAVQACSVLACIFSILGLFVFVAQLFTLKKGQRFTFSGIFQFIAFLCIMVAASIYTDIFHKNEKGSYGPSFILAWISFTLTFISSIIYFVLRKKTA
ncbi:epithelial membrane protein 2-like [Arapaima gigas]